MKFLSVTIFLLCSAVPAFSMGDMGTLFPPLSYPDTSPVVVSQDMQHIKR